MTTRVLTIEVCAITSVPVASTSVMVTSMADSVTSEGEVKNKAITFDAITVLVTTLFGVVDGTFT
jgi:hypothetical protein